MSEDVQATVNVLSQSVSAWAESVTRLGGRLDDLEASVGRLRAWADAHEDEREAVIRANAAKPSPMDERRKVVEEREIWTRLGDQLAALGLPTFRRVEKERDEAQKRLAEVTANLAATQAEAGRLKELLAANDHLKKQIEDLQGALAEARKETPAGVQDQFRLEKLGRLFDSLFAGEDDLTDETREFWMSLETAGWLRPSRVEMIVRMQEAAQAELKKFKTDENTLRVQLLERIQHLEEAAGGLRERVRELTARAVEASEESRQARIAEDIQRVEKEKAFERVQYLEKALANLSTAHEGLLADKEKALADKEHAVCPYCHRCATCGTA